ncbi:MAG: type III-B CRISPR-associated protein Cas10/Cmr2 [Thermoproteota archaeon]
MNSIFLLKAAALLHDPVNKPWIITERISVPSAPPELPAPDGEAVRISDEMLKNTALKASTKLLRDFRIESADILAMGIHGWLLSALIGMKCEPEKLPVRDLKLRNLFYPNIEMSIESDANAVKSTTQEMIKKLNQLLITVDNNDRLAYHILYAFYEPLWISMGGPPNPADTRIPTYTVFDHTYAMASISNWFVNGKEPKGLLLVIDLPGVQGFISKSRKLRDLWISSYLVSALAWRIAWMFIEKLGPDVLLMPTCRHNPFYYYSFLSMLGNKDIADKFSNLIEDVSGYNPRNDIFPLYPVIPGTLTLILPDYEILQHYVNPSISDKKSLEQFIIGTYKETWKSLWELILNIDKQPSGVTSSFIVRAIQQLKKASQVGFEIVPPLPIRVVSVEITQVIKDVEYPRQNYKLYHYLMTRLWHELNVRKLLKMSYASELNLSQWTEGTIGWPSEYESKKGFEYCTSCGELPAILIIPRVERSEEREKFAKTLEKELEIGNDQAKQIISLISPHFSGGEKFCPYCLIKRILAIKPEIMLKSLLGNPIRDMKFEISFPSTSDVASIDSKERLLEMAITDNETKKKLRKILNESQIVPIGRVEAIWNKQKKLREKVEGDEVLELFVMTDAESLWFGKREVRSLWSNLIRGIEPKASPTIYYALIRADGDNMGKLISGDLEKAVGISTNEYIKLAFEGQARDVVQDILGGKLEEATRVVGDNAVSKFKGFLQEIEKEGGMLTDPLYHVSLSRALMRAAIRDVRIVKELDGLSVYSGGDDLLALAPISKALDLISNTRFSFGMGSSDKSNGHPGFEKLKNYYIPSLFGVGRCYAIYEAHYRYPMHIVMRRSSEIIEEQAKEANWATIVGERIEKDTLATVYSSRGGEKISAVPLRENRLIKRVDDICRSVELAKKFLRALDDGTFSESLIYDVLEPSNLSLLKELVKSQHLLESYLFMVLKRNAQKAEGSIVKDFVKDLTSYREFVFFAQKESLIIELFWLIRVIRSGARGSI